MKILIVEDDEFVSQALAAVLNTKSYAVEIANNGLSAWELIENFDYDLLLLDVMLPKIDGISLCRQIRARGNSIPILLLTGRDSSHEKAVGLDAGADDYLVKPFDSEELLARVRALLRRGAVTSQPVLEWGKLRLDPTSCEVSYDSQLVSLTPKEYALLELFLRNSKRVFSCGMILEHLWAYEDIPGEEAVRTHIKGLRQKLKEKGASSNLIETVYGIGYRLKPQLESSTNKQKDIEKLETNSVNLLSSLKPQTIAVAINELWHKYQEQVIQQVSILEEAAKALSLNSLNQELHLQAEKEAHTLAGSLGIFGFPEGSKISREIEILLKEKTTLSNNAEQISKLVKALQRVIKLPPQENPLYSNVLHLQEHPLILFVGQDVTFAEQLTQEAKNWNLQIQNATSIAAARNKLYQEHPSIALLDADVFTKDESLTLLAEFNARKPLVPVLIYSENQLSGRLEATCNNNNSFLQKPSSPSQALEAVNQLLQHSAHVQLKVLAVDDDPKILALLQNLLTPWGLTVKTLVEPQAFWETLEKFKPDLLILDVEMPEISGIDLCSLVRNHSEWSDLPILFLTLYNDADIIHQVFSVGADDFVSKPFVGPELVTRIINRLERIKSVRRMAQPQLEQINLLQDPTVQKESQELPFFLEIAQIGTWEWNIPTNQFILSLVHERLFGIAPGSFDGTLETFINCILEADREIFYSKLNQARFEHTNFHHKFRIVWPDTSIHWIEAKGKFYYNNVGEAVRMLGVVADISAREEIEASLRNSKQELKKIVAEHAHELIRVTERLSKHLE